MKRRRMLGLFVAFYAAVHFFVYLALDLEFAFGDFARDVQKRPYIAVGAGALALLVPLTLTSTDAMIRRLGRWWPRVHLLVYPAAILGVLHYYLLIKRNKTPALWDAAAVGALLLFRAGWALRARLKTT